MTQFIRDSRRKSKALEMIGVVQGYLGFDREPGLEPGPVRFVPMDKV